MRACPSRRCARCRTSTIARSAARRSRSSCSSPRPPRRREIAIRFALGARTRDVQGRIVRQGVVLAGIGVVIGLVSAAGVTRLMTSLLYDVEAIDPLTYAAVAAGLIAVAAFASYLPARRASTVAPAESLAAE